MARKVSSRSALVGLVLASQLAWSVSMQLPAHSADGDKARPHIDLAFCIDTTGSMSHEINNVKTKTKEIVAKLASGKPSPVVRVALVAFRDRGDDYVTRIYPFTEDIDRMVKDISGLTANGGGDAPEAVNEALHASVNDLKWSSDNKTVKLLFLVGDAGPKVYSNDYDWHKEAKTAIGKGIQINTIGCQGLEANNSDVEVFRQIAHLADGKYESLTYKHDVIAANGKHETVVASGGALYRVKDKAAADWRSGAKALDAMGAAEKVAASSMAYGSAGMESGAAGGIAAFMDAPAMPTSAREAARVMRHASMRGAAVSGVSMDRKESNLSDLVLEATKKAAKDKLDIDFVSK